ncbi:MAG: LicD family protein [Alphaproteobacteria bacterium]|nr:LicD family protein [Alphaproteobacteria bacterium]
MKIFRKEYDKDKLTTCYYLFGIRVGKKRDKIAQAIRFFVEENTARYQNELSTQIQALGNLIKENTARYQDELSAREESAARRKNELMTWYTYSTDITKLPKATGPMGIAQQADALFLSVVSKAFDKHGIRYSVWAGTLIGALRHQGFIPWDDDIDIMVFDDDYYKIRQVIAEEFKDNPDIYTTDGDCTRIYYRGTSMQIDCFHFLTFHNYFEKDEDRAEFKKELDRYNQMCEYDWSLLSVDRPLKTSDEQIRQWTNELLLPNPHEKRKMIVSQIGISGASHIYDYDWIFPLKKIKFDAYEFWGPNKPEIVCYAQYGDYMKLPTDFHIHNDIAARITPHSLDKMMQMIKSKKLK